MKLTFNYDEINRIIQLFVCKELKLTPVTDIDIVCPSEEYGQEVEVNIGVYHETPEPEDCDDHGHRGRN